jgi:phytoene desaturase
MASVSGRKIVVVGGGVGGLAAALRLAHAGAHVTVLEKNERVGGKLNLWEVAHPGRPGERPFRFDTGPSLITLPRVFEELFADVGERLADHLTLTPLDPIQRFVWADGMALNGLTDAEVARVAPSDIEGWRRFSEYGKKIWDLSAEMFLWHSPEQLLNDKSQPFDGRKALSMLTIPLRIGMFKKYASVVERHVRDPRLREVLYQYATYSGASPFRAPGTLATIAYAESAFGGWHIEGGLYRLAEVLAKLIEARGGVVRTGAPVARIDTEGGKARGVRLVSADPVQPGEFVAADVVIANADVVYASRELLAPPYRRLKYGKLDPGGSGFVLMLGVEGRYPQLAHHTKFMPDDYRSDLRAMFETRMVPEDPCIYVCAPTRSDPSLAPEGCENLFILVSAPPLDGNLRSGKLQSGNVQGGNVQSGKLDWSVAAQPYRNQIVDRLERRFGLTDLSRRIVVEQRYTPADLESRYHANRGTIYGVGSNSRREAFLRPPNRDRKVKDLYFVGGGTHPGGGLPLVTLSGKIVAELIAASPPAPR